MLRYAMPLLIDTPDYAIYLPRPWAIAIHRRQ